jgi:CRISPR-associated protein Cas5d
MVEVVDIKVWGDYACFTQPESKVERESYPVITPAAARGILEAIYWKPQFCYRIKKIGILNLGSQTSILRNEISSRQSPPSKKENAYDHYLVADDGERERQQRTSRILQNVAYRIRGWIVLRSDSNPEVLAKHLDCFRRKAERGQYFQKPYLGCREFAADFELAEDSKDKPDPDLIMPIGNMLFDTAYIEDNNWYKNHPEDRLEFWRQDAEDVEPRIAKGYTKRLFFDANINKGWINVPQEKYKDLDKLEDRNGIS